MHTSMQTDRNAWRVPPDETLQVADPKAKKAEGGSEEVSISYWVKYTTALYFYSCKLIYLLANCYIY